MVADFRDLSAFPDAVFDTVYFERVPLGSALREGGAAEIHRVLADNGRLVIVTGETYFFDATERAANLRALQEAGFGDIDFVRASDNWRLFDAGPDGWAEIAATKIYVEDRRSGAAS